MNRIFKTLIKKGLFFLGLCFFHPFILTAQTGAGLVAAGALGYTILSDAVKASEGDVSYSFDEVNGVLLPDGRTDISEHKKVYPSAQVYEATHDVLFYLKNPFGHKAFGIEFSITFLYDDSGAIGNISLSVIDVYDLWGYGGNIDVNIIGQSLDENPSFRFSVNVTSEAFFSTKVNSFIFYIRGGDGKIWKGDSNFTGTIKIFEDDNPRPIIRTSIPVTDPKWSKV